MCVRYTLLLALDGQQGNAVRVLCISYFIGTGEKTAEVPQSRHGKKPGAASNPSATPSPAIFRPPPAFAVTVGPPV